MPFTRFTLLCFLLGFFALVSCQQPYYGSGNVGVKDHSDAVVHINQVDPAYRSYFAEQHGSNYSLKDQRKAFYEAVKTSKTPVQQDARHMSANSKKKSSRKSSKKVVRRKASSEKSTKKTTNKSSSKKTTTKKKTNKRKR